MEIGETRFGLLTVDYVVGEKEYHCACDCGTKIIVTQEQLTLDASCGCVQRNLLLSAIGFTDYDSPHVTYKTLDSVEGAGVNFEKRKDKWRARITFQSREYHLGYYDDKETAIAVRKEAESKLDSGFLEWLYRRKDQ